MHDHLASVKMFQDNGKLTRSQVRPFVYLSGSHIELNYSPLKLPMPWTWVIFVFGKI